MSVSRRQLLKWGGLGVVGAGLVTVPISTVSAKSASQLSSRDMPKPYQTAFVRPPKLTPKSVTYDPDGSRVNHYEIAMRSAIEQRGVAVLVLLGAPVARVGRRHERRARGRRLDGSLRPSAEGSIWASSLLATSGSRNQASNSSRNTPRSLSQKFQGSAERPERMEE